MAKPGTLDGDELWIPCPDCGLSSSGNTKFSINRVTRQFHCFRCGVGGIATRDEYTAITGELPGLALGRSVPVAALPLELAIRPGPGSPRPSGLDRYHAQIDGVLWDAFGARDLRGDLVGIHLRGPDKRSRSLGTRGLGYTGDDLARDFVRLVEGPYDVLDPEHDVCTFGMPSPTQVRMLRSYQLVLCPDGDVWTRPHILRAYLRKFVRADVLDIEMLPDGQDPDDVAPAERLRLGTRRSVELIRATLMSRSPFGLPARTHRPLRSYAYAPTPEVLASHGD